MDKTSTHCHLETDHCQYSRTIFGSVGGAKESISVLHAGSNGPTCASAAACETCIDGQLRGRA